MSRAGLDAESPEINEGIAQIWDNRHGPIWPEAVRLAQRACMTELLQFRMKPLADGRRTELSLAGSLPSAVPAEAMRELIAALAVWSSAPVSIVLIVDERSSDWCERWSRNLRAVGHDAIEVRFELADEGSP